MNYPCVARIFWTCVPLFFDVSFFLCGIPSVGADPLWTSVSACSCNNLFVPLNLHFQVLLWGHSTRSVCHSGEPPGRKRRFGPCSHCMRVQTCQRFQSSVCFRFNIYTFKHLPVWETIWDSVQQSFLLLLKKNVLTTRRPLWCHKGHCNLTPVSGNIFSKSFILPFQGSSRLTNIDPNKVTLLIRMQICHFSGIGLIFQAHTHKNNIVPVIWKLLQLIHAECVKISLLKSPLNWG